MTDLAALILAAIDTKKTVALEAAHWHGKDWEAFEGYRPVVMDDDGTTVIAWLEGDPEQGTPTAAHIAANDPRDILRRCAADRRTVERHAPVPIDAYSSTGSGSSVFAACVHCRRFWPCPDIQDRAEAYGIKP